MPAGTSHGGPQMVGSPLLDTSGSFFGVSSAPGQQEGLQVPDRGISAWRSLFIGNELNERLTATRTSGLATWLLIVAMLEVLDWKSAAKWYPGSASDEALAAQMNPFLQFALGGSVWLLAIVGQLIVVRLASIKVGHDLHDFVDACSLANVSVFIMDQPFHGFYIHGQAPSGKGDWCHTELAKVMHDEEKDMGLDRGLIAGNNQTFEVFMPPNSAVPARGGEMVHFRQELYRIFTAVRYTNSAVASRRPAKATDTDVAQLSHCRCSLQTLLDTFIHAVMRGSREIIQERGKMEAFLGLPPPGGVAAMRQPIFYQDPIGLAWSSCLAYGSEVRIAGLGFPTGFEWHLILSEQMLFSTVWRFQGSVYLAAVLALLLDQGILKLYAVAGRRRLAYTAIINSMFLI